MSTRNKKNEIKIEQPITPETRKEVINKLVEEQAQIFDVEEEKFLNSSVEKIEAQPVDMTDEEIVAQDEFINETPEPAIPAEEPCTCDETCVCETPEKIKETLEIFHNIDAEEEVRKLMEASANPQKFAEDYIVVNDGKPITTPIDTLPEESVKVPEKQERKRKTFAQMTATEMNIYHKTGIIPFC